MRLVSLYKQDWKIIFPEPNFKIITWRLCRSLACSRKSAPLILLADARWRLKLTLEWHVPALIYTTTLQLLSRLPPFTLGITVPDRDFNGKIIKKPRQKREQSLVGSRIDLAETTLLAAIAVTLKLIYGMGEIDLCVSSMTES